jgi:hypothetical protein
VELSAFGSGERVELLTGAQQPEDLGTLLWRRDGERVGDYPQIGLADAMSVVLAREFRTDVIATLDRRHFRTIRPMTRHGTFRLLPDDVPEA